MVKYLEAIIDNLTSMLNGMNANAVLWNGQSETPEKVQERIDELVSKGKEIDRADEALKQRRAEARILRGKQEKYVEKLENLANGIHNETPEKLVEYNISSKKNSKSLQRPSKILIPVIEDDTDGQGFIITTQKDPDAKYYEWLKGESANVKDLNTIPELNLFKTTTKTTFVDDDIQKGVRYFYKVQAVNSKGTGPESEPTSRVQ